jgi:polyhydroxybutyrate depolymerase
VQRTRLLTSAKILVGILVISGFLFMRNEVRAAVYAYTIDTNNSGCIDVGDITTLGASIHRTPVVGSDVNDDGKVDMIDAAYIAYSWGAPCLPFWNPSLPPAVRIKGDTIYKVKSGGMTRSYTVHVPPNYTGQTMPLVLNFHGASGQASGQETTISLMNASADSNGYIVVYPNGSNVSTSPLDTLFFWNVGQGEQGYYKPLTRIKNIDDVAFVSDLLDKVESDYNINSRKVYVAGLSNGGMMSQRLACHLANRITAMASVEGNLWEFTSGCTPSRPIPTLLFSGTGDLWIPFNGGASTCAAGDNWKSAQEVFNAWKSKNSCTATSVTTTPSSDMSCQIFTGCAGGSQVGMCTIQNGGHTWPGGGDYVAPSTDPNCSDPGYISTANGDQLMWNFFNQFTLP